MKIPRSLFNAFAGRTRLVASGVAVLAALSLSACNGGRSETAAERFVSNLNYDDPFEYYRLAKDPTLQRGYIVVSLDDGTYRAVDITDPDRWVQSDLKFFWDESFRVWDAGNGYYEDIYGYLYEQTKSVSKDLEKVSAQIEKLRVKDVGEQLAANYGLSESRGIAVAKLLTQYKALKKERALTEADLNSFSTGLLGFSLAKAEQSFKKLQQGDANALDSLIEEAASANDTTPENIRQILGQFTK
jgi:hypothetical protein